MNKLMVSETFHVADPINVSSYMRAVGVIAAALIITLSLLYAMHYLIHNDYPEVIDDPTGKIPEFVMNAPPPIMVREEEPPVRPIERQLPPPVNPIDELDVTIDEGGVNFSEPVVIAKPPINGTVGMGGQMVPFIKIAPQYPTAAAAKGVEGYVDVMFDVTELGSTDNIRIIGYVPSAIFNKSVIKAVRGWKYKPHEVDGVAVRKFDVKDRIRFAMEK
ncbi:MAG TPA: TonB family protein [Cellvibrio sp.]|nr:TonB family protein [Cellvibrio sp.]